MSGHSADYCDNQTRVDINHETTHKHRAFYIWDRTIVKLRTSLRRTKVRSTSGEDSSILHEKREAVRLSTDTSEDFV